MSKKKQDLLEKTIDEVIDTAYDLGQLDKEMHDIDKNLILNARLTGLKGTTDQLCLVIGLLRDFAVNTFKAAAIENIITKCFDGLEDSQETELTDSMEDSNEPSSDFHKWDA